jgi:glycosyltransferase involved in cell wall biosynthesis
VKLFADTTRLLRRHIGAMRHTGIDRVNLEYARWVHRQGGGLCLKRFVGLAVLSRHAWGRLLLGATQPGRGTSGRTRRQLILLRALLFRQPVPWGSTLLVTTHSWLGHHAAWQWLERRKCRVIVFIHDLIPIQFPEYSHPREKHRHTRRLSHTLHHAAGIIVNSACTAAALHAFAEEQHLPPPPTLINPLGHDLPEPDAAHLPADLRQPYFVILGTIEPRKNHLLLLTLWREMARRLGERTPQLVVVGRRGWECEQVVDMLERCETIHPHLLELNDASDELVAALIMGARALLMPSFAEGFGMPVQESLAWGTPVISTPLAAIKEFAGEIPDYADPHDGARWLDLIEDYMRPDSSRRARQMERLKTFRDTRWPDHFSKLEKFLETLPDA